MTKVLFVNVNKTIKDSYGLKQATSGSWSVDGDKSKFDLIIPVSGNIIRGVFEVNEQFTTQYEGKDRVGFKLTRIWNDTPLKLKLNHLITKTHFVTKIENVEL